MSGRECRKALPLDHTGIRWGTGERHESGTPWEADEWQRFETWACENGANGSQWVEAVEWRDTPCGFLGGHGYLHREDGPAQVWSNGTESWWLDGKRHRPDGPARVFADGYLVWRPEYQRPLGGPVRVWPDGIEEWLLNDQIHCENWPPARIGADSHEEWWLNGIQYTNETFTEILYAPDQ
jgi:hypothetical protein